MSEYPDLQRELLQLLRSWGGKYGVDVFADTDPHTPGGSSGSWSKLVAKGATVIASLTSNWTSNPADLADGEVIYGNFTALTLTSGELYCYRDKAPES